MAIFSNAQAVGALQFFKHTRVQESSADQAAAQYLEATGQSIGGIVKFFERFRYQEIISDARRYPYFRSHPLSSDRIAALQLKYSQQRYRDTLDTPEDVDRLAMMKAKIIGFLEAPQTTFNVYPETDQSRPARYARALGHFRASSLDTAMEEIDSLIAEEPENPYYYELKGQILFESGQAARSIEPFECAVELAPIAPLIRVGLAQSLLSLDQPDFTNSALDHLKAALLLEPVNGLGWYQLSIAHERRGETALAQLAIAEQAFAYGDQERASLFAARARDQLQTGTTEWQRANDILFIYQSDDRRRRG